VAEYRLDDLGWFQFERLCQALLAHHHGLAVETWGGTGDWGRDAWAPGPLAFPDKARSQHGPFLFQCKFVERAQTLGRRAAGARLVAAANDEARRIAERLFAGWEVPAHYALITNAEIDNRTRGSVARALETVLPGSTRVHVVVGQDLESLALAAPEVRMSFPQILGFRDLEGALRGVLHGDIAHRTEALLTAARDLARVFVPTTAHHAAVSLLQRHRWVVLAGAPEMGKTSIARMIALAQAAGGWDVIDCADGPASFDRAQADAGRQIFIADDAFGSTEYRPALAQEWEISLPRVIRMLGPEQWMIFTSRTAPLRAALDVMSLRDEAERFPDAASVIVDASSLSREEKALIVYRHARAVALDESAKMLLRDHLGVIVDHPAFTPLRVRRFLEDRLPALAEAGAQRATLRRAVDREMGKPLLSMRAALRVLSDAQRDLLISLLDVAPRTWTPRDDLVAAWERHGSDVAEPFDEVVTALTDHFVRVQPASRDMPEMFEWVHPSWRELVLGELRANARRRRHFLERTGLEGLLLALSTIVQVDGSRELSLVADPADWEVLRDRARELGRTAGDQARRQLMTAAENLLHDTLRADVRDGIEELLSELLVGVREGWDEDAESIASVALDRYFKLSELVRPLPPAPQLDVTWSIHEQTLSAAALGPPYDAAREALSFVLVVNDNEPRSVRQRGFPDRWTAELAALRAQLEAAIAAEDWSPSTLEEAEMDALAARAMRADHLYAIADSAAALLGGNSREWRSLVDAAYRVFDAADEDHQLRVESLQEHERAAPAEPQPGAAAGEESATAIEAWFSDL
jgi:hypothetical protein